MLTLLALATQSQGKITAYDVGRSDVTFPAKIVVLDLERTTPVEDPSFRRTKGCGGG